MKKNPPRVQCPKIEEIRLFVDAVVVVIVVVVVVVAAASESGKGSS